MDTPDKNRITVASLSKFEDSPVFNYISSLSPIEQIKSIHTDNSFNSVNFTSPSSLFATPKISSLGESRFLLSSNQSPDILKPDLPFHGKENKTSKRNSEAVQLSDHCTEKLGCLTPGSSERGVVSKLLDENLELAIELPKNMKHDGGGPVSDRMSCDVKETNGGPEMAGTSSSLVQSNEDNLGEADHFENKSNLRKICRIEQSNEVARCDWVTLISDAVLNSDLSIVENNSEDEDQKTVGEISFISTVLQLPQDNANDLTEIVSVSPSCSFKQSEMRPAIQPEEIGYLKDMDQTPDILSSTLLNKLVVSDPRTETDNEEEKCNQSSCKQHNIRRRCLVFEMAGSHKKQAACESNCRSSIPSQTGRKEAYAEKHLVPSKAKNNCSSSMVTGVGLHLNALATTSKNSKVVKCETLASGRKLISMRSSVSSSLSLTSCQSLLNKSSTLKSKERDPVPSGNEVKVEENALQPSVIVGCEEFDLGSPKRKRCKPEHNEESKACKRCNCKRSKCLKLYCECFAAGLYCVEPCSCLDCFNKPIYEDKVLETRRQIEFRNPLAFAPKVIRSTDSAVEFGDETNKTPASARHKKGCNCKRSSCLKKYCECFQGGVGCSIGCRCEGCKNSFGRKYGAEESDYEGEESEACEKNESDANVSGNVVKEGEEEHPDFLLPSSDIPRAKRSGSSLLAVNPPPKLCISLKPSNFFNQPRFEEHFQPKPEDTTPKILKNSFSQSSVIPASSTSQRVSSPYLEIGSSTRYRSRRFTLRSSLSFPSVTPPREL